LVLKAYLCSLYLTVKLWPVCPIYALLQSGQVNLYAPDFVYLSGVGVGLLVVSGSCWLCARRFSGLFS
jgi:hypothetical protein